MVNEGFVAGQAEPVAAEAGPAPIMVDYDAENGVDGVDALSKAIQALKSVAWENEEIMWFFNQAEISLISENEFNFVCLAQFSLCFLHIGWMCQAK